MILALVTDATRRAVKVVVAVILTIVVKETVVFSTSRLLVCFIPLEPSNSLKPTAAERRFTESDNGRGALTCHHSDDY